jgi:hypothetical protein
MPHNAWLLAFMHRHVRTNTYTCIYATVSRCLRMRGRQHVYTHMYIHMHTCSCGQMRHNALLPTVLLYPTKLHHRYVTIHIKTMHLCYSLGDISEVTSCHVESQWRYAWCLSCKFVNMQVCQRWQWQEQRWYKLQLKAALVCVILPTATCKINGTRSDGVPVVNWYKSAVENR